MWQVHVAKISELALVVCKNLQDFTIRVISMKSVKSPEIRVISMKSNDFKISYTIFWSVGPLVLRLLHLLQQLPKFFRSCHCNCINGFLSQNYYSSTRGLSLVLEWVPATFVHLIYPLLMWGMWALYNHSRWELIFCLIQMAENTLLKEIYPLCPGDCFHPSLAFIVLL